MNHYKDEFLQGVPMGARAGVGREEFKGGKRKDACNASTQLPKLSHFLLSWLGQLIPRVSIVIFH